MSPAEVKKVLSAYSPKLEVREAQWKAQPGVPVDWRDLCMDCWQRMHDDRTIWLYM